MKTTYQCERCETYYDNDAGALECEATCAQKPQLVGCAGSLEKLMKSKLGVSLCRDLKSSLLPAKAGDPSVNQLHDLRLIVTRLGRLLNSEQEVVDV